MRERRHIEQGRLHPDRIRRAVGWRWRMATSSRRALPDFVILGAQRSGTTSLFDHLSSHPQILPPYRKEIHFHDLHHNRGVSWYRANFPLARSIGPGQITGEATPNYLVHPDVPGRLARVTPEAKLMVLLRNPVDRAHSAWRLRSKEGRETATFEQAVEKEQANPFPAIGDYQEDRKGVGDTLRFLYLAKSRYAEQVERWLDHFPLDRFLFMRSEDLFSDPEPVLGDVSRFLGIGAWDGTGFPAINQTAPAPIEPEFRARLVEYFAPHNRTLEKLVGRRFDWD
ncbi:MAG: sulfotransferase domain-containing protein [Acidimicrobiia bacterium]